MSYFCERTWTEADEKDAARLLARLNGRVRKAQAAGTVGAANQISNAGTPFDSRAGWEGGRAAVVVPLVRSSAAAGVVR